MLELIAFRKLLKLESIERAVIAKHLNRNSVPSKLLLQAIYDVRYSLRAQSVHLKNTHSSSHQL